MGCEYRYLVIFVLIGIVVGLGVIMGKYDCWCWCVIFFLVCGKIKDGWNIYVVVGFVVDLVFLICYVRFDLGMGVV